MTGSYAQRLDRVAQRYHIRPSELISGTWEDWCFDEAIATRSIMEENKEYRKAREEAEKASEVEIDDSTGAMTRARFSGKVGEIQDMEAYKQYIALGGTWNPKKEVIGDKPKGRKKWIHR